jgi:membrane protein YqaA with SNARE-associated domain
VLKLVRRGYEWMLDFSGHPYAVWILAAISFAESSFFPLPPDPLMVAMMVENNKRAWMLAGICTISSVVGGVFGYWIGYTLYASVGEWIIHTYQLQSAFDRFQVGFQEWGFWIVVLKGLTPIPYKVVTIFSGVSHLSLSTFLMASIISRGSRFYLLATILWFWGPAVKRMMDRYLNWVALGSLLLIIGGIYLVKVL